MTTDSDDLKVVTPVSVDEEADSEYDSPAERIKDALSEELHRDFVAASDDHPLVETAGSKEALLSDTPVKVQKLLSDDLYQDPQVFWREWLQNHTAACIREAKRIVKNEHGMDALHYEFEHDHDALDDTRRIRLPKNAAEILPLARDLGYDPVIEFEINHDEQKIVSRDNGIGMTTGEVIERWNEPAESASGADLSSAGNKGIGALTWASIAGVEGAISTQTRTRREQTVHTGQSVPAHDRAGYHFYSFLGGVIPIPGDVEDAFYGTEFEIPIQDSVDSSGFKRAFREYADILPVKVLWTEYRNGGQATDEFEAQTFFEQYGSSSSSPRIRINRPGEFSVALDKPGVVTKSRDTHDTFLLDMPIERNTRGSQDPSTLWNDHMQFHNEQGLIVAGPHRGRLQKDVEELHPEDVPLPQPTADRDRLTTDEAHSRFVEYVDDIAVEREVEVFSTFANEYLATEDIDAAMTYVEQHHDDYQLLLAMMRQHGPTSMQVKPTKMFHYFAERDEFDFDAGEATRAAIVSNTRIATDKPTGEAPELREESHPKWPHLELLKRLQKEVSYASASKARNWDPNLKENRGTMSIAALMTEYDHVFVGKTLNQDRARVVHATYENAVLVKPDTYSAWLRAPFHARKLTTVPFTRGDHEWEVPDAVHQRHLQQSTLDVASEESTLEDAVQIRAQPGKTSIDYTWELSALTDRLERTALGEDIPALVRESTRAHRDNNYHQFIVVFPATHNRNISEYYWWQQYAALIKCQVATLEELHDYEQVFLPEEFEAFQSSTELYTYDPFSGEYGTMTVEETVADDPERVTFLIDPEANHRLANLLVGTPGPKLPDNDGRYRNLRHLVLGAISSRYGLKSPREPDYICEACYRGFESAQALSLHQNHCAGEANRQDPARKPEYRVAWWRDRLTNERVWRFYQWQPDPPTLATRAHESLHTPRILYGKKSKPSLDLQSGRPNNYKQYLKRGPYVDAWALDSEAWDRFKKRRNTLKSREKAMYRAVRAHGIDPYEHSAARVEQVLYHLLDSEGR